VWMMGVALALTALLCFYRALGKTGFAAAAAVMFLLATLAAVLSYGVSSYETFGRRLLEPTTRWLTRPAAVKELRESAYHHIAVVDANTMIAPYTDPARLLFFNNQTQSGLLLDNQGELREPAETACGYVDMLSAGMIFTGAPPERMLVVGGGGGVAPQLFKGTFPDKVKRIDVVDIDPWVFRMAAKWFGYPFKDDPVIRSHVMDGRRFVATAPAGETWDYIVIDAYTSGGRIPRHLVTREYFHLLRERLAPGGVLVLNVISGLEKGRGKIDGSRLYRSVFKTLSEAFGGDQWVYTFPRNRHGERGENIILVATTAGPRLSSAEILHRYDRLAPALFAKMEMREVVNRMSVLPPETGDVPLLTDDFCPTDSMTYN